MKRTRHLFALLTLLLMGGSGAGQSVPVVNGGMQAANVPLPVLGNGDLIVDDAPPRQKMQPLLDFKESDIKFPIEDLMGILRDRRHEGWVLAAYPDPKTQRPLIGAGFSLDVERVDHPQRDPLNPNSFLEPSSADLWQAAGLQPERLDRILERYRLHMAEAMAHKRHRRMKLRALAPDLTEEEATRLLRISAIQAVYNARAYCRNFDQLSASQQMALSQLVFQMGVNLEEFVQFLTELNQDFARSELSAIDAPAESMDRWNEQHWTSVQETLIDSQWARLYSERAASVIAMFEPTYAEDSNLAQQRIEATLRPAAIVKRGRRPKSSAASLRTAVYTRRVTKSSRKSRVKARRERNRKA